MLKDFAKRLGAGLVSTVMVAAAAAITLVAASFAVYAGFKMVVSPAAASALTALIFAGIAGLIAVLAPKLAGAQPVAKPQPAHHPVNPATLKTVAELGAAVFGLAADMALNRRLKRQQKDKQDKARRRH